ncbi:MAG TPA: cytochrome c oxidase subunit II [Pirellulales bacterium]|nr:cytochrome c oxidase subunit II [Pirellulales bacterium]
MGKFWALVFLCVPIFGVAMFIYGPAKGVWLPENVGAETAYSIDHLFKFILALTGIVFLGTELTLFLFLWRYDGKSNKQPAKFSHGSHTLEICWTIVPAATLLFIAIYQMNTWAAAKMRTPMAGGHDIPFTVEVTGRQFEWRLRYPGEDGILGTKDDLFDVNELHVPVGEEVLVSLKSMDVLHSFFLPNLRVKQDAVPGMKIPVWFRAMKEGEYDIPCAELCGWGHYKMKGRLVVESREAYEKYLADLKTRQNAVSPPGTAQQTAEAEPEDAQPVAAQPQQSAPPNEATSPLAKTNE